MTGFVAASPSESLQELGFFAAAAFLNWVAHLSENLLRSRLLLMQPCNSEPCASIPHSLRASLWQARDTLPLFDVDEDAGGVDVAGADSAGAELEGGGVCAKA